MKKVSFKQGQYQPQNFAKYKGTLPIVYRSSWELRIFIYLDNNPYVLRWGSESVIIPYVWAGKTHRYFVDLYFEVTDKAGTHKKFLVEVKPHDQSVPPVPPKRMTAASSRNYTAKALTYQQNVAKWKAAAEYAKKHGMTFFVLTEKNASFLTKS